jgi:hypothetical protein
MTIKMDILSAFDDSGVKKAQASLKSLLKSQLGVSLSMAGLAQAARVAVTASMQDSAAQKQLSIALANATSASVSQQIQTEKNIAAMQQQFAVADDQLRPALATLARTTGDFTKSQDLLKVALDISAATGRDLSAVSESLGKAYQGNVGLLRRMGLSISDTAVKSKDFSLAMQEVNAQVGGAAAAAAQTAEGKFKKLSIRFQDLTENVGANLLTVLVPVADALDKIGNASLDTGNKTSWYSGMLKQLKGYAIAAIPGLGELSWLIRDNGNAAKNTTGDYLGLTSLMERVVLKVDSLAKVHVPAAKSIDKAKEAAKNLAKTTRDELNAALESARQKVQAVMDKMDEFTSSIRSTFLNYGNLSGALDEAKTSEDNYTAALQERVDAYAELNKLEDERRQRGFGINDQVVYDADAYAAALKRVADAETGVTKTQAAKTDYSAIFASQIAAAKSFANNLQALANAGLGNAGIQQLLALGPIGGAQVAQDLLNGVGGLSINQLNNDIAGLNISGALLGMTMANTQFGGDLASAQTDVNLLGQASVGQKGNTVTINVNGGDPNAVVDALRRYMQLNGSVPIRIGTL